MRAAFLLISILVASAAGWCARGPAITRSAIHRQGGAWVEDLRCDFPLRSGRWLALHADRGSVDVTPGPSDHVRCRVHLAAYLENRERARNCLNGYELKVVPTDSGVDLTGRFVCSAPPQNLIARFDLEPPLRINLELSTRQGGLSIERLQGQLRAQTAAGDITAGNIMGPVFVSTGGGAIHLGDIGAAARIESGGGGIQVGNVNGEAGLETRGGDITAGVVNGPVEARTGAGSIALQAASGPVVAISEGGQIRLGECGNSVRVRTAGGNVQVAGAHGRIAVETAGGNISLLQAMSSVLAETARGRILARIDASSRTFGPSRLVTGGGDVDLLLPPGLPVTISALMAQPARPVASDFPLSIRHAGGLFSPLRAEGSVAGGGANLSIRVDKGGLQIRRVNPAEAAQLSVFQQRFWRDWREAESQRSLALRQLDALRQQLQQQNAAIQEQLRQLNRQFEEKNGE
ncbi:MAG: hypothetical protein ACRD1N_01760 [Terriglobia bacterium]